MLNFKLNILSNIPKRYLPIVLLKKLEITINNPTLSRLPVKVKKLPIISGKKAKRIKLKNINNRPSDSVQLNETNYNDFADEDIISTCYNSETDLQEHDAQALSKLNHDLVIECKKAEEDDSSEDLSNKRRGTVKSNNYEDLSKTTCAEVEVSSSKMCSKEQELFSNFQVLDATVPQVDSFTNFENNKLQADQLQIDVENFSQSDEKSRNIQNEDFHNNNSSSNQSIQLFDSTESLQKSQLPQTVNAIEKSIDHDNRLNFIEDLKQVKDQVIGKKKSKRKLNKCPYCAYVTVTTLSHHFKACHPSERPYKCSYCSYASKTKSVLNCHIRMHTNKKQFKCSICSFCSTTYRDMKIHECIHFENRRYKCTQCTYSSANPANLRRHVLSHSGIRPFKCSLCSFSSITSGGLRIHSRSHTGQRPYNCTQCLYASTTSTNLRRHMRIHLRETSHKCSLCSFVSDSLPSLNEHLHTHQEKPSTATEDTKLTNTSFNKSDTQSKNINKTKKQSGIQLYFCYDCNMSFKQKKLLENHWRSRHYSQFQKVYDYTCSQCQQVSTCYGAFIRHIKLAHQTKSS